MHTKDNGHHNTGHGFLAGLVTLLKKIINIINSHLYCFDKSSLKTLFLVEVILREKALLFENSAKILLTSFLLKTSRVC